MLAEKVNLEKEKKALEQAVIDKHALLQKKLGAIGNVVHDSVPVHNNEVSKRNIRGREQDVLGRSDWTWGLERRRVGTV